MCEIICMSTSLSLSVLSSDQAEHLNTKSGRVPTRSASSGLRPNPGPPGW